MKLYFELAPWFHLLTHPDDYAQEADFTERLIEAAIDGEARTLLELGSGGGNNASYLKRRFECTLTDVSRKMLELSRSLNPECEHLEWTTDPDPADTSYDVDYVVMLREPGKPLRVEHDRHALALFPEATWRRLLEEAGLEVVDPGVDDPDEGEHAVFVARRGT